MRAKCINRELTTEVIVGAFMMMVLLGLGYFTIILSKEKLFQDKHEIEVLFSDVMGLRDGDNVVCRGMPIGTVSDLDLREDGVHVFASLDSPITLYKDYKITVETTSILGGRLLTIEEGTHTLPKVENLAPYDGVPPYDLIEDASAMINGLRKGLVEDGTIDNMRIASEQLRDITQRVNDGEGFLGKLLSTNDTLHADVTAVASALRDITQRVEEGKGTLGKLLSDDDQLYRDLSDTVASLKNVATRLDAGESTLGKLVSDDAKVYNDLADIAANLRSITERIDNGDGSLGRLLTDDELYNDISGTVKEARDTLEDFRETSPVSTFGSIMGGAL